MKKTFISMVLAGVVSSSFAFETDLLTGDTRLSCEAILCLSSSVKPGECQPSLNRFFSIKMKKWSDTLNARRAFLNLCPVGDSGLKDAEFRKLRDDILVYISEPCNIEYLNTRVDYKTEQHCGENSCWDVPIAARIDPVLPQSCKLLQQSKYTDIKVKYTCPTNYYPIDEWDSGYTKTSIDEKTYNLLYKKDPNSVEAVENESRICRRSNHAFCKNYFQKTEIKKNCWVYDE